MRRFSSLLIFSMTLEVQAPPMRFWKAEHREAVGDVGLPPRAQLRGSLGELVDCLLQAAVGFATIAGFKDDAQITGHRAAHLKPRDIMAGILLQVKLAALPGHAGEAGRAPL